MKSVLSNNPGSKKERLETPNKPIIEFELKQPSFATPEVATNIIEEDNITQGRFVSFMFINKRQGNKYIYNMINTTAVNESFLRHFCHRICQIAYSAEVSW